MIIKGSGREFENYLGKVRGCRTQDVPGLAEKGFFVHIEFGIGRVGLHDLLYRLLVIWGHLDNIHVVCYSQQCPLKEVVFVWWVSWRGGMHARSHL